MAKERRKKTDHLLYADVAKSRTKEGVWFVDQKRFKKTQRQMLKELQDRIDWVKLPDAILAVSTQPVGIVVLAPNPTLPGFIVCADGTTKANTEKLQKKYQDICAQIAKKLGVDIIIGEAKE